MTRFGRNIQSLNWEGRKDHPVSGACYVQRWSINLIQSWRSPDDNVGVCV